VIPVSPCDSRLRGPEGKNKGKTGINLLYAGVAKLADASDLGSDAVRHVGSSPIARTKPSWLARQAFLYPKMTTFAARF
jgi:hypothetical protein